MFCFVIQVKMLQIGFCVYRAGIQDFFLKTLKNAGFFVLLYFFKDILFHTENYAKYCLPK
jgi:hypothetical protein